MQAHSPIRMLSQLDTVAVPIRVIDISFDAQEANMAEAASTDSEEWAMHVQLYASDARIMLASVLHAWRCLENFAERARPAGKVRSFYENWRRGTSCAVNIYMSDLGTWTGRCAVACPTV